MNRERKQNATADFTTEEKRIEAQSATFKKELGLTDLVLTQILFIVGLPWVGVAAKQGPSHVVLWMAAIALFYIPSALVVIHLNRAMPLEGGIYQWAKLGIGDLVGFMVGWNLWLFAILNTSEVGLQVTQYMTYIMGPGSEWLTSNVWFIAAVNTAIIAALIYVTVVGLGVGKWIHKAGGVLMAIKESKEIREETEKTLREKLDGFGVTHSLMLHHKSDGITPFAATEILKDAFGRYHKEGSGFLVVERAQRLVVLP